MSQWLKPWFDPVCDPEDFQVDRSEWEFCRHLWGITNQFKLLILKGSGSIAHYISCSCSIMRQFPHDGSTSLPSDFMLSLIIWWNVWVENQDIHDHTFSWLMIALITDTTSSRLWGFDLSWKFHRHWPADFFSIIRNTNYGNIFSISKYEVFLSYEKFFQFEMTKYLSFANRKYFAISIWFEMRYHFSCFHNCFSEIVQNL